MITELTNIVRENLYIIPPIILGVYGGIQIGSGFIHEARMGMNAGLVEIVRGGFIMTASGMSIPLLYKLSEYLQQ